MRVLGATSPGLSGRLQETTQPIDERRIDPQWFLTSAPISADGDTRFVRDLLNTHVIVLVGYLT